MDEPASFSSSIPNPWTYHVFLSFHGVDTRYGFTYYLYRALERKGIRSFMDRENVEIGEEIFPAIAKAIEQSMTGIIVFSQNYAHSTSCLEELVKIIDCIKRKGRMVLPIFYKVEPSNIKHQTGSYELAFHKHEERFGSNSDKLRNWKSALCEAANLRGECLNKYDFSPVSLCYFEFMASIPCVNLVGINEICRNQYEYDFIERIIDQVSGKINGKALHSYSNYPVDLESRELKVISLLGVRSDGVRYVVCSFGIAGVGRTKIVHAWYNFSRQYSLKYLDRRIFGCKLMDVSKGSEIIVIRQAQTKESSFDSC